MLAVRTYRLYSQTVFSSAFGLMAIINELLYRVVKFGTNILHMHSTYELCSSAIYKHGNDVKLPCHIQHISCRPKQNMYVRS